MMKINYCFMCEEKEGTNELEATLMYKVMVCEEKEGTNELETTLMYKVMVCDDCLRKIDELFEESEKEE